MSDGKYKVSTQANITILDINDNSPRFTSPTVFYSWTNDTIIGYVQATDDDSRSKISYFVGPMQNAKSNWHLSIKQDWFLKKVVLEYGIWNCNFVKNSVHRVYIKIDLLLMCTPT